MWEDDVTPRGAVWQTVAKITAMFDTHLLRHRAGHLLLEHGNHHWVVDTGSPVSFGSDEPPVLAGQTLSLGNGYMGLTAEALSGMIGHPVSGVLGTDVLNQFDVVLDLRAESVEFHRGEAALAGNAVPMSDVMGVPVVDVDIEGRSHAFFFDTGASVSYCQLTGMERYPPLAPMRDFYPGFGEFDTVTWQMPLRLGATTFLLRTGRLPPLLGMALAMAGTKGIVGNAVCLQHRTGYFPRRRQLVLG